MLNIDTRILDQVDQNEFWLLSHLVKRLNKNSECWPSNRILCRDTGWQIDKLQRVKTSLSKKGIIEIKERRHPEGGNGSNAYIVKTDLIGVYISVKEFGSMDEQTHTGKSGGGHVNNEGGGHTGKSSNEVLTTEVLFKEQDISLLVIDKINQVKKQFGHSGKFQLTDDRRKHILARIKETGFKSSDVLAMIEHRGKIFLSKPEMVDNFNPDTLFRKAHFIRYVEQSQSAPEKNWMDKVAEPTDTDDVQEDERHVLKMIPVKQEDIVYPNWRDRL
jgi:hypothetical protein